MSDVQYDTRPEPDANTSDITSYLLTKNLTRDKPPLTSPTASTQQQPPAAPPDQSANFPPYQPGEPPPALRQVDPMAIGATRPDDRYTDPMEAINIFKNPAFVLAGLASMLTRAPITTALNAGAAAMKGFHQGQMDVYQQNKERFDENLKMAMEQNRVEIQRYNAAWDRRKEFNWEKVAPKMYEEAAARGDVLMTQALNSHNWELVEKILLGREQASNAYDKTLETMDARDQARAQEIERWKQDPSVIARAKAVKEYRQPYPTARSMNNFRDIATQELVDTGDPYDTQGYAARSKAIADMANSKSGAGARIISLNTAVRHFDTIDRLIDELGSGNNLLVNHAINELRAIRNDPAITNYEFAAEAVAKEIVKSLVPVGAGGVEERARIADAFSKDHSPAALHALVGTGRELLGSQMLSIKNYAYASHAGPEFEARLEPETRKALDVATGEQTPTGMPANIAKALKDGHKPDEIKQHLRIMGYDDRQIEQWFSAVK